MPYFIKSGLVSERYPFHGDVAPASAGATAAAVAPAFAGLVTASIAYGASRAMAVDQRKALGIAAMMGLITAFGQIAGNWMRGQVDKATTQLQAAQQPAVQLAAQAAPKVATKVV